MRPFVDTDWPDVLRMYREVHTDGDTYALPPHFSDDAARSFWLEPTPGIIVVRRRKGPIESGSLQDLHEYAQSYAVAHTSSLRHGSSLAGMSKMSVAPVLTNETPPISLNQSDDLPHRYDNMTVRAL
jgi:hypothetical protein